VHILTLFSVDSLPAPNVTPVKALASALVISWQGSMSVATADGSADSEGASLAGAVDGDVVAVADATGGKLAFATADASADGDVPLVQAPTLATATMASAATARRETILTVVMT
jgi:hypothetical protein